MSTDANWKRNLELFFHHRALSVEHPPTILDHCRISGKDPRLWMHRELYTAMIDSVVGALALDRGSNVLEVGCASGFVASGLAPRVGRYCGVDLVEQPLTVARLMALPNAEFLQSDGAALRFADGSFDAAFAYDVFTNFPTFADGAPLITEMLRVVKPGGRVLVGSLTSADTEAQFRAHAAEVGRVLDRMWGPNPIVPEPAPATPAGSPKPAVVGYYFNRADFSALAAANGVGVEFSDVHIGNPFRGFRFNAIFTRPTA